MDNRIPRKRTRFSNSGQDASSPDPRKQSKFSTPDYSQYSRFNWQAGPQSMQLPQPPMAHPLAPQPHFQPSYSMYNQAQPAQPPPQRSDASTRKCPDSLKRYIERSFGKCQDDSQRDEMETLLRDIIAKKKSEGSYYTANWDKISVPKLTVKQKPSKKAKEETKIASSRKPNTRGIRKSIVKGSVKMSGGDRDEDANAEQWQVVGTATNYEKEYLRLTCAPDPSTVRPLPILKEALEHFKERWKKDEIDYIYFLDQLRSIRQDLTVQHIKNKFTATVYQINARLALQAEDLGQFNQCTSRLEYLFSIGVKGRVNEFIAYRVIYFTLQHFTVYLEKCMKKITQGQRESSEVAHALEFRTAVISENYPAVFKLWKTAPNMGESLIQIFIPKLRMLFLLRLANSYRPSLTLDYVKIMLAMDSVDDCRQFLEENGGTLEDGKLKCEQSIDSFHESKVLSKRL